MKKIFYYLTHPARFLRVLLKKIVTVFSKAWHIAADWAHNRNVSLNAPHVLILRDIRFRYNQHFLKWLKDSSPGLYKQLWLASNPNSLPVTDKAALFLPWLQDPLKERDPVLFEKVSLIEEELRSRGIKTVNPVNCLSNSIKTYALPKLREIGLRTAAIREVPKSEDIGNSLKDFPLPAIIREDSEHGSDFVLAQNPQELKQISLKRFQSPVAVEFIDVRREDGFTRKYRAMVIGDSVLPRHLLISRDWNIHINNRIRESWALDEERGFLEKGCDDIKDIFVKARKELEFNVVAFDYSYDKKGQLVVWEPNPFPVLYNENKLPNYSENDKRAVERIYPVLKDYFCRQAGISCA